MDKWNHFKTSLKAFIPDCDCEVCTPIKETARVLLAEMDRLEREENNPCP